MLNAFRVSSSGHDNLHIFGETFRQPKGNVSFFSGLLISEPIDSFNHDHNFLIDFLRAVYYLLLLDLSADDVEPVGKEFSDVLFEQVDWLFEFE